MRNYDLKHNKKGIKYTWFFKNILILKEYKKRKRGYYYYYYTGCSVNFSRWRKQFWEKGCMLIFLGKKFSIVCPTTLNCPVDKKQKRSWMPNTEILSCVHGSNEKARVLLLNLLEYILTWLLWTQLRWW